MRHRLLALAAGGLFSAVGCSVFHSVEQRPQRVEGRVITEEMIAATPAVTAWDVIERSGFYRTVSDPGGSRSGIHSRRGKSSILLPTSDVPRLIIDGARVSDLSVLHQISARSIAWIEMLGGIAGGAEEGMNTSGGVIRVVSKAGW